MNLPQIKRIRWGVRAVLVLGVAASTVANILHADPNPISQTIAAWPPLALLLTVELISRIPVHRRSLAAVRLVATSTIAGIAAWVSYWHMTGVAGRYGEDPVSAHLLPLSVDGLVIVASVSLVELAGRIRTATEPATAPLEVAATTAAEDAYDPWAYAEPVVRDVRDDTSHQPSSVATKPATRRPAKRQTAAGRVAKAAARTPSATPAQLAARLKISERTVQRHLRGRADDMTTTAQQPPQQVNGATVADLITTD